MTDDRTELRDGLAEMYKNMAGNWTPQGMARETLAFLEERRALAVPTEGFARDRVSVIEWKED